MLLVPGVPTGNSHKLATQRPQAVQPAWWLPVVVVVVVVVVVFVSFGALATPSSSFKLIFVRNQQQHALPNSGSKFMLPSCSNLTSAYSSYHSNTSSSSSSMQQHLLSSSRLRHPRFPHDFWFVKTYKTGSTTLQSILNTVCFHYGVVPVSGALVRRRGQVKDALGRPAITKDFKKIKSMKAVFEGAYTLTDAPAIGLVNHLPYNVDVAGMFNGPLLLFTVVRHPVATFHSLVTYRSCYRLPGATWETCGNNFGHHKEFVDAVRQRDTLENRWVFAKEQTPNNIYHYIRGGASSVETAAAQYDFIFVTERMDEALVVFMLEYGLTFLDIVNKRANTKQHLVTPIHAWPKELNQFVADKNQKDLQLWEIANKRLDEKVALLKQQCGAAVFAAHLETFRHLQGAIQMQCADPKLCEMQGISNSSNRYKFERLTCHRYAQSQ